MKPNCSNIAIVSIFTGKIANNSLEPSNGGMGIRLKKANKTFQKITITHSSKNIDPSDPAITPATLPQLLKLAIMSSLAATGIVIILARTAKITAINIFEPGPANATAAGPHF